MFPLKDENPTEITPFITFAIIAANVLVWLFIQGAGSGEQFLASLCEFGAIPAEITGAVGPNEWVALGPVQCRTGGLTFGAAFTSMFLHGGWFHLIGNMWFLWVFGNNIEDSMGHMRFVVFYLVAGLLASGAHILSAGSSTVPTVGASGAISGIMGAYLLLYPKVRVQTAIVLFIFIRIIALPAWVMLGYWFAIQVFSGAMGPSVGGGVAFWAHVGGFVAGVALIKLFENDTLVDAKRDKRKLSPAELRGQEWW